MESNDKLWTVRESDQGFFGLWLSGVCVVLLTERANFPVEGTTDTCSTFELLGRRDQSGIPQPSPGSIS